MQECCEDGIKLEMYINVRREQEDETSVRTIEAIEETIN